MVDRRGDFRFLRDIHVITEMIVDISTSMRPMVTQFGKKVHLDKLSHLRLIEQVLVALPLQNRVTLNTFYYFFPAVKTSSR